MDERLLEGLAEEARGKDAVLIAGPTASGKSALAAALARAVGGVVVNADSMQVYRDLQVLSARPGAAEQGLAPHHLYGFVEASRAFSVGDYLRVVRPLLDRLRAEGRPAIVTGGTGLYFRALTEGLADVPPIPADVAAAVAALDSAALAAAVAAEDPDAARRLSPADRPRLERALGVRRATGRTLRDWQAAATAPALASGRSLGVFLHPDRAEVARRIDGRFAAMVGAGALEEAERLRGLELPPNRGVMKAHGLPHLIAHLEGRLPLAEAIARGQGDTRRYAKRQVTWARRFMADWRWVAA